MKSSSPSLSSDLLFDYMHFTNLCVDAMCSTQTFLYWKIFLCNIALELIYFSVFLTIFTYKQNVSSSTCGFVSHIQKGVLDKSASLVSVHWYHIQVLVSCSRHTFQLLEVTPPWPCAFTGCHVWMVLTLYHQSPLNLTSAKKCRDTKYSWNQICSLGFTRTAHLLQPCSQKCQKEFKQISPPHVRVLQSAKVAVSLMFKSLWSQDAVRGPAALHWLNRCDSVKHRVNWVSWKQKPRRRTCTSRTGGECFWAFLLTKPDESLRWCTHVELSARRRGSSFRPLAIRRRIIGFVRCEKNT